MDTRITISISKRQWRKRKMKKRRGKRWERRRRRRGEEGGGGEGAGEDGDPRLPGPPSVQGISGWTRIRDRKIPADFRADSLSSTCFHSSWKFGNALVSIVANDLKINRTPIPVTTRRPRGAEV
ncbi:hypothetical protein PoB_005881700 [Plakobranchus ocellatus]|uniref:Uncharacterized protein n=1 Tax=Plakobranchus ocellatus TaxID=259542 RepID=A0AAV4CLC6_9GAST|nr:hypothetical protein PoB_005881700 [Plakobranchus ocellatus]